MKRLLITLLFGIIFNTTQAQTFNRPVNPESNIGLYGGAYTQLNLVDYAEFGGMVGVNFKDIVMVGPFYQTSIYSNDYYGLYTQFNINPKQYYVTIGLATRIGLVNGKYIRVEPALTFQHNTLNDNMKFCHQLGITNGLPSYNFGVIFGNFGMKWWKNTGYFKSYDKKQAKMIKFK